MYVYYINIYQYFDQLSIYKKKKYVEFDLEILEFIYVLIVNVNYKNTTWGIVYTAVLRYLITEVISSNEKYYITKKYSMIN